MLPEQDTVVIRTAFPVADKIDVFSFFHTADFSILLHISLWYTEAVMDIKISRAEEGELRQEVGRRSDFEAGRIKRYLAMPDLSRTPGSPIHELVKRILAIPNFKDFDVIDVPEIMAMDIVFDLFDFPADHPARSRSDSYFIDDTHVLRTHTTVMWYYWLREKSVQKKIAAGEAVGALSYGKVYRKDEIDARHMNVFHQIDGWYLARKEEKALGIDSSKWNGWAFGFGLERLAIISMQLPDIRLLWSDDERVKKQLVLGQAYK